MTQVSSIATDGSFKGKLYPSIQKGLMSDQKRSSIGPHRRSKSDPMAQLEDLAQLTAILGKRNSSQSRKKLSDCPPLFLHQIANPDFEGWLKVQGTKSALGSSMKNRWVLLKGVTLFIFASDQPESKILELIDV
jgi:hypothetical protein